MATRTLGLTGSDYTTLAAWASYANALSLAANEILEVRSGGAIQDTSFVVVGGWTANGFSVTMRPFSGNGIADHASKRTNALRYDAALGAALTNNVSYSGAYQLTGTNLVIEGLQFRHSTTSIVGCVAAGGGLVMRRSIIHKDTGGSAVSSISGGARFDDCVIQNNNGIGFEIADAGFVINGCSVVSTSGSAGTGVRQVYAVGTVVKNTAVVGFGTDFQGTAGGGTTNNATDKGSFGGTGWGTSGQTGLTSADFESLSTPDWRIKAGSTKLIDTGAGSVGTGFDITNTARGATYDIGAWEAGAGGSTPVAFTGTVPTINAVVGTSGSVDLASYFSGTLTPFTYTTHAGTLPTGFSRSGSVISWTTSTTVGTTTGIQVRATDTGTNVATTNSFSISVTAVPSVTINDWVNNTGTDLGGTTGVDIAFLNDSTRALVLYSTNNTISGGHDITISNAALTVSSYYVWVATKSSEPTWFASGRVQAA